MKNILFYISIAFAIFSPNTLCAHSAEHGLSVKLAQQDYATFDYRQPSSDKLLFDVCFEDIFDDDSTDSERKKVSSAQKPYDYTSFVTQNFSDNNFNTILPADPSFPRRTPLFIFICVFRI